MINYIDSMVYFYLLFPHNHMYQPIEINQKIEQRCDCTTSSLITNGDLYDINLTVQQAFINGGTE